MDDIYRILNDPSKDIYTKLDEQANEFWDWSKSQKQIYEWETNYPNWHLLTTLFSHLVETTECTSWSQKTINNLLYLIARDNECEQLVDKLSETPLNFIFLAKEGLQYPDSNARWQLAHYLSELPETCLETGELIYNYFKDDDEYVRRRALLALGLINSKYSEQSALESWEINLEYQKIAALEVLYQIKSTYLEPYLQLALIDKHKFVRANAERIIEELRK